MKGNPDMSLRTARLAVKQRRLLRDWFSDDRGQDLIEYMLLASFIAIAGWLGAQAIGISMNTSYEAWDQQTQDAWEMLDPIQP